jgi:hypothetical protein
MAIPGDAFVYIENEATAGTAETIVAADVVSVKSCPWEGEGASQVLGIMSGDLDSCANIAPSMIYQQGTIEVPVRVSPNATTAPELSDFFLACGLTETITTNVVYEPSTAPDGGTKVSCTLQKEEIGANGKTYKAAGVRFGNPVLRWEAGSHLILSSPWMGSHIDDADRTGDPTASKSDLATELPVAVMTSATIHGESADIVIRKITSLPIGFSGLALRPDGNTTNNVVFPAAFTGWMSNPPVVELEVEHIDSGRFDSQTAWKSGTQDSISFIWTQGARTLTFNCPIAVFSEKPRIIAGDPLVERWRMTMHGDGTDQFSKLTFA